jgi:hypothetical protein
MVVRRTADVEGQSEGAAKRGPRIKLWHWIVIVAFAALATDIGLRLRGVPETSKFPQPSAAEIQALDAEIAKMQKEMLKSTKEFNGDSSVIDDRNRLLESAPDGALDLRRARRTPDGTGVIIQL